MFLSYDFEKCITQKSNAAAAAAAAAAAKSENLNETN